MLIHMDYTLLLAVEPDPVRKLLWAMQGSLCCR
jgi:hypothetical protein